MLILPSSSIIFRQIPSYSVRFHQTPPFALGCLSVFCVWVSPALCGVWLPSLSCRSSSRGMATTGLAKAPARIWGFLERGYLQIIKVMNDHDLVLKPTVTWGSSEETSKCVRICERLCQNMSHVRAWVRHYVRIYI